MATSGSKNFSVTRSDIINAALKKIGAYDAGKTPGGAEDSDAAFALNVLIKEWAARGIDIWLRQEIILFLQPDQQSYQLGLSASDHATSDTIGDTTLSSALAASGTTVSLTSTANFSNNDNIGIKLDDNSIHWTTITDVGAGTITTGPPSGASAGNRVYAYTTKAHRPQKLLYLNRRSTSDIDTEMDMIGENEYRLLSTKGSGGPPNQAWYKPTLATGTLFVWPVDGGKTVDKVVMQAQLLPDDFDVAGDDAEFPIEWANALIFQLAHDLAPEYGVSEQAQRRLFLVAEKKLNDLLDYDIENASVRFALDGRAGLH